MTRLANDLAHSAPRAKPKKPDSRGVDILRAPPCASCGALYYHAHFSWCTVDSPSLLPR